MGATLVKQAMTSPEFRSVNDRSRLVLLRMALIAHDGDARGNPGRWYYESRVGTAQALGFSLTLPGEPDGSELPASTMREGAFLAVRRAIRDLVAAGAIQRRSEVDPAHRVHTNRQEEYFVMVGLEPFQREAYLEQWRPAVEQKWGASGAPQSGHEEHPSRAERGTPAVRTGVHAEYPQGTISGTRQARNNLRTAAGAQEAYSASTPQRESVKRARSAAGGLR